MKARGDHQRGSVLALFVSSDGIEIDEPHLSGLDWLLVYHGSVTGALAADVSSASAR
jgi:hypothetical protein